MLEQIDRRRTRHQATAPEAIRPSLDELMATTRPFVHDDPLLSKNQACAYVNCSYPTLWAAVRAGELAPGRYVGNRVHFLKSELDGFIESRPRQKFGPAKATEG